MAGDWIKIRSNIKDDPDVVVMAGRLESDEFSVVGRLHAVWAWLDQHSEDGTNVRITSAYLDRLTACSGFADAMRAVGWLDGRDGLLVFPNFGRHNGESAKHRATETKRKSKQRSEVGTNVPQVVPTITGPEKRREEKNTSLKRSVKARSVEEIISELKKTGAYEGIDFDSELKKMHAWLTVPKNRGRQLTHRFIMNWLNKCDLPLLSHSSADPETEPGYIINEYGQRMKDLSHPQWKEATV